MPELNFNALIPRGPQSVAEGFNLGQEQANQLMQQQQARQLNEIQLRNAMRGEKEAMAESEAAKGSTSLQDLATRQRQAGLAKQALATEAAISKQRTDQLTQAKTQVELIKHTANQIFANPQNAAQILTNIGQRAGIDVSDDLAQIQQLGGDPNAIKQWAAGHVLEADKMLPKFQQFETPGGGKQIGTVDPRTGMFTVTTTMAPQMKPGESERIALERQRVGLEGQRVNLAQEDARLKREGIDNIAPKELQKREAALPQATSAIKGFENKSDAFISDLKKLRDHPGLNQITGLVAGRIPAVTSEGRAAQALYDKIIAKGGFQALQDLRDASKTGGALGNVSNQEGRQLASSFAAIQRTQDAPDVRAAIDQAIGDVEGSKTRMREAYDATYAYKKPAAAVNAPNIDALLEKYK
jgi:hypothetical protein